MIKKIFLLLLLVNINYCYASVNIIGYLEKLFGNHSHSPAPTKIAAKGSIIVAFSPNNGVTATIVNQINQAKNLILVSAYSFSSKEIAQALLLAQKRGVGIKIILDKSQYSHQYSSSRFFVQQSFDIRIDVSHAIFHDKIMIIDHNCVITGSFNFTRNAEQKNAENLLVLCGNADLVNLYEQDWYFNWNSGVPYAEMAGRR
jgi:phosphatidylserine/phosphatidylglycerophosphate/cardiolipin synthase-like enzyme